MKWYLHKHHQQHAEDLRVKREDSIEMYYTWVIQIANTFARDGVAIGILNFQDLIQAGYVGLVEAFEKLDHSKDQAEKWAYLKKRIKFAIRREIDNHGAFIKVPRRQLEDHRKNLTATDKILVSIFPRFFDKKIMSDDSNVRPWEIEQLSELVDNYLYTKFRNIDNVDMLKYSFGIDIDRPMSFSELSIKYRKPIANLRKTKQRMLDSLREDEDFEILIENFYKN